MWQFAEGVQEYCRLGGESSPEFRQVRSALRGCAGWSERTPLLETFTTVDRPPLGRPERHGCFFSALRTNRFGFDALGASRSGSVPLRAIGLARLAPLGLVLETPVGEKHLLARGENELSTTLSTLQHFVVVFHTLLPGPCFTEVRQRHNPCQTKAHIHETPWIAPVGWHSIVRIDPIGMVD
jgi:hypothetical protein